MILLLTSGVVLDLDGCHCPACRRSAEVARLCVALLPLLGPRTGEGVAELLAMADAFERRLAEAARPGKRRALAAQPSVQRREAR